MLAIRPSQLSALEQDSRQQIALAVLADLRSTTPHAVAGLSTAEVDFRLHTAVSRSQWHELNYHNNVAAFVRLSFIVGPHFDEYPAFKEIFANHASEARIPALFLEARPEDWNNASQFEIVSRYQKKPEVAVVSLTALAAHHVDDYWRHALHPDVWRLGRMKPLTDRSDVAALIQSGESANKRGYAIVDPQKNLVGALFVTRENAVTRVSYWVARPVWGQGIASQALMQLKAMLVNEPLTLTIEPGNTPSFKVATKCGFRQTDCLTFMA